LGQAVSAAYGNDRTKYSMICSIQETLGGTVDGRLKSTKYVSINGGSPAYLWVDRVCTACYTGAQEQNTIQELIDAFNYAVTFSGNPAQQGTILNNYVATNSGSITAVVAIFSAMKTWAQGMPGGNTIAGLTSYEGGYSVGNDNGNWTSTITAATKTTNCVMTFGTTGNNASNPMTITGPVNPAVAGMQIMLSGFTGGFATFNGLTVNILSVAGSSITTDLDASAQASSFSGTASALYVNSDTYVQAMRLASKGATGLGTQNTNMYNGLAALAGTGFVSEYPSNFLYTGKNNQWSVLDTIYSPLNSQWNSIVAFNSNSTVGGGKEKWRWLEELNKTKSTHSSEVKTAAAILSKMGGHARAVSLTSTQRSNIASTAAKARWK